MSSDSSSSASPAGNRTREGSSHYTSHHDAVSNHVVVTNNMDEEVDELDGHSASDSEATEDDQLAESSGSSSHSRTPALARIPGHSFLEPTRVESIIQADGVAGHLAMSKEALFLVSIATEEFIARMTQAGQRQALTDRRATITYKDMAFTTQQYQEFMFLKDTIPTPISIMEALERREAREKELSEGDPAVFNSVVVPTSQPNGIAQHASSSSKSKSKSRTSGREKRRTRDNSGRWSEGGSHQANGTSHPSYEYPNVEMYDPQLMGPPPPPSHAYGYQDEAWPTPNEPPEFGTGYLQPQHSVQYSIGRQAPSHGRTIYTAQGGPFG